MTDIYHAKCAIGTWMVVKTETTLKCGNFPELTQSFIQKVMGGLWESSDYLEKFICALCARAERPMNQPFEKITYYVWGDVKRGTAPTRRSGVWTLLPATVQPAPSDDPPAVDWEDIVKWAQNSTLKAARLRRERIEDGYVEVDLDGRPLNPDREDDDDG